MREKMKDKSQFSNLVKFSEEGTTHGLLELFLRINNWLIMKLYTLPKIQPRFLACTSMMNIIHKIVEVHSLPSHLIFLCLMDMESMSNEWHLFT